MESVLEQEKKGIHPRSISYYVYNLFHKQCSECGISSVALVPVSAAAGKLGALTHTTKKPLTDQHTSLSVQCSQTLLFSKNPKENFGILFCWRKS